MKKFIVNLIILLLFTGGAFSADRYYYYGNQKIYLPVSIDKIFFKYIPSEVGMDALLQQYNINGSDKIFLGNDFYLVNVSNNFNLEAFTNDNSIIYASRMLKYTTIDIAICNRFVVKVRPEFINQFHQLLTESNLQVTESHNNYSNQYILSVSKESEKDALDWANYFYEKGYFTFSEPVFFNYNNLTSNDPEFNNQWNLKNTGQKGGVTGADIKIEGAWEFTKGREDVIVAVIDAGVDLDHPDIEGNLVEGFDMTGGNSHGEPDAGTELPKQHGTGCAGIIAAIDDNNIGITGIAPNCKIMPIKISTGIGNFSDQIADGIDLAVDHHVDILSCSFETPPSSVIDASISNAVTNGRDGLGIIIVVAAANDSHDPVSFPSSNSNTICVGAMNMCNERIRPSTTISCEGVTGTTWGSNFGNELDVMAPGTQIVTLKNGGGFTSTFNGTSAACPHVAGVMALLLSVNRCLTLADARKVLESTCDKVGPFCYLQSSSHPNGLWNNEMGYGRINALEAVKLARSFEITNFSNLTHTDDNITDITIQMLSGCVTSPQTFFAKKHTLTKNITYNNTANPTIKVSSNGLSTASPNSGNNFAEVINVTSTGATLKTHVYELWSIATQQSFGFIPVEPNNIRFHATVFSSFLDELFFQNQDITSTQEFNSIVKIKAGHHITSSETFGNYIVKSPANIIFRAGEEILLEEGFETEDNAEFLAVIEKLFTCTQFPLGKRSPFNPWQLNNEKEKKETPLNHNQDLSTISIFPNPTFGITNLYVAISKVNMIEINLLDVSGKIIKSEIHKLEAKKLELNLPINLSNLDQGIYFVQVRAGYDFKNFKIIKL